MPISEMQSRVFAALIAGHISLPSREAIELDIEKKKTKMQSRYLNRPRHTIQVMISD